MTIGREKGIDRLGKKVNNLQKQKKKLRKIQRGMIKSEECGVVQSRKGLKGRKEIQLLPGLIMNYIVFNIL